MISSGKNFCWNSIVSNSAQQLTLEKFSYTASETF